MQALISFARERDFNFTPELDGKIHRFDRDGKKEVGWFVGWQLFSSKTAEPYEICVFGDWRTNEKHEFKSHGKKLTKDDQKIIKEKLQEAVKKAEQDRLKKQDEAKAYAEKLFSNGKTEGTTEYLVRKKIAGLNGAKILDDQVLVPMVDEHGSIWGCQKILPDGKKFFCTGQRVSGLFHLIGNEPESICYIAEGFATASTIHEVTGSPVFVAFNAGNLINVAKTIRRLYRQVTIVIAGDDDVNTEGNPGRTKALEASKAIGADAVFPPVPTDFNDFFCHSGAKEVISFFQKKPDEIGYIPLGFDRPNHFFYAKRSNDIVRFSAFTSDNLLQLMPIEYWESIYSTQKGIQWDRARSDLIAESTGAGPFNPHKVRGTGVWFDRGVPVINTGFGEIPPTNYIYVATRNKMKATHHNPLTADECTILRTACHNLRWKSPDSAYFLCGWIAIARIAGALPIRPHIWLTGSSGSGKSTVMDKLIRPALGDESGRLYLQGGSTEAGIRQSVKADSLPIIFDEFETTNEQSKHRVESIVELFRQSWSRTDGQIVKGSAGGEATQYALSFAGLVSSIRTTLTNDADRSRFSILELDSHKSDEKHWQNLKTYLTKIDEEYGERLFARQVKMIDVIVRNYEHFSNAVTAKVDRRTGQQLGMLLAGYASLIQDHEVTELDAQCVVDQLDLKDKKADDSSDEVECLNHLMAHRVKVYADVGGERRAVLDKSISLILDDKDEGELEQLKDIGIALSGSDFGIVISSNHPYLKKSVFGGTRWEHNFYRTLLRIQGSTRVSVRKRFANHISCAVKISL